MNGPVRYVALLLVPWVVSLAAAQEPPSTPAELAPDDQIIFTRNNDLYLVSSQGRDLRQLTASPDRELAVAVAPDASCLVYEAFDNATNEFAIYRVPLSGGTAAMIIPVGHSPSWSPDAGRLLYTANVQGGYDVFMCDRDGGQVIRVTDTPSSELFPVWSPDGAQIAYLRDLFDGQQRSQAVIIRDAAGLETELTNLVGMQVNRLVWGPGEKLLLSVRTADNGGQDSLYELAPAPGKPHLLTEGLDGETSGSWLPGGQILCSQVNRTTSHPVIRHLDGRSEPVAGTDSGDSDPVYVPGAANRAPVIVVRGQRSYYLPAPRVMGDDVLLPLAAVASQLGWHVENEGQQLKLSLGEDSFHIDPVKGSVETGDQPVLLNPVPQLVGTALLAPIRALAERLRATCTWEPTARIMRVELQETPDVPVQIPAGEPATADTP